MAIQFPVLDGDGKLQGDTALQLQEVVDALAQHIAEDLMRWQQIADTIAAVYAAAIAKAKEIYDGTTDLDYNFNAPTTIIGTNGLISLGASEGYTFTANGAIICTYNAVLGAVKTVYINGTVVWTSPVSLLGIGVPPSDPIRVSTGDVLTTSGLLGLGEGFNITFYPNI